VERELMDWIRTLTEIGSISLIVIAAALRVEHRITALETHIEDYRDRVRAVEQKMERRWNI
jgi:hypothetical protein